MFFTRKKRLVLFFLAAFVILTGCNNKKSSLEKMYETLENVAAKEKVFEEQQEPLVTLEKKEKGLYDQIIGLGMKEYDEIVKLSDEALDLAAQRQEHMEKETKSIKESEKEFKKIAVTKEQLDDPSLKKLANELYDIMMERYQAHDVLYTAYTEALKNDQQLYEMFKNKNLQLEDLEGQVVKLNDSYKKVFEANENFNKLTEQYNDKKLAFYKKAELITK
ncbi:YkyA family protein [Paenibacillus sp. BSR1-1]|uniref:YkyA family protein n=1 Tax=Paenibacillus sp. BSR1-1 TaxID=3020845 RepID=UPI0025B10965|nr:YkyA family protein [Paenibacillus sp. BSR1-1]MDN3014920.1 YkyA family protein [Paenibacillus sp. BSR1-1]